MPRDTGTGVYTRPPGTDAVSNATASSKAYNAWVADVEFDLNAPRPISAGGTGASNAADALTNLGVAASIQANVGFLSMVSSTQIKFGPYGGDQVKINGKVLKLPSGGVIGNATDCYLDGVVHSTLVVGTTYYVYLFDNNGVLTIDYSTTPANISVASNNAGVWIKTGDNTRSLIGMVRIAGGITFLNNKTSRYVRSWFNRQGELLDLGNSYTTQRSTSSATPVEVSSEIRVSYLIWTAEKLTLHFVCPSNIDTAGIFGITQFAVDGATDPTGLGVASVIRSPPGLAGTWMPNNFSVTTQQTEGWHQASIYGWVAGGGGIIYYGTNVPAIYGTMSGCIHS